MGAREVRWITRVAPCLDTECRAPGSGPSVAAPAPARAVVRRHLRIPGVDNRRRGPVPLPGRRRRLFAALLGCGAFSVEMARRASEPAGVVKDVYAVWELPVVFLLPGIYALSARHQAHADPAAGPPGPGLQAGLHGGGDRHRVRLRAPGVRGRAARERRPAGLPVEPYPGVAGRRRATARSPSGLINQGLIAGRVQLESGPPASGTSCSPGRCCTTTPPSSARPCSSPWA